MLQIRNSKVFWPFSRVYEHQNLNQTYFERACEHAQTFCLKLSKIISALDSRALKVKKASKRGKAFKIYLKGDTNALSNVFTFSETFSYHTWT